MIILDITNGWKTAIMLVAMVAVFYLFLIRPQSQKQKKEKSYRDNLRSGDRVMTAGGIHATFVSVQNGIATIEVAPHTTMRVQISTLNPIPEHSVK